MERSALFYMAVNLALNFFFAKRHSEEDETTKLVVGLILLFLLIIIAAIKSAKSEPQGKNTTKKTHTTYTYVPPRPQPRQTHWDYSSAQQQNTAKIESDLQSPYEVLGITDKASGEEIKTAFYKMSSLYHPDKVAHLAPEFQKLAETRMKAINIAYESLKKGQANCVNTVKPTEADAVQRDELYYDALKIVVEMGRASTSVLQRRLSIGYARAAKILDHLEHEGFIGVADGAKPRKVLQTAYDYRSKLS
jgi:DNA segregation ATPase FtsK/SpoIIIE-like protein